MFFNAGSKAASLSSTFGTLRTSRSPPGSSFLAMAHLFCSIALIFGDRSLSPGALKCDSKGSVAANVSWRPKTNRQLHITIFVVTVILAIIRAVFAI